MGWFHHSDKMVGESVIIEFNILSFSEKKNRWTTYIYVYIM